MSIQGNDDLQKAQETYNWSKTTGTITYSKVSDAGIDPSPGKINKSSIARIHRPVIKYNYRVNNLQYQGNTIYFGDDNARNVVSYADEVVAKYRPRQQAVVSDDTSPTNSFCPRTWYLRNNIPTADFWSNPNCGRCVCSEFIFYL